MLCIDAAGINSALDSLSIFYFKNIGYTW